MCFFFNLQIHPVTLTTVLRSVNATCCVQGVWFHQLFLLCFKEALLTSSSLSLGLLQEQVGARTPRRRWTSRDASSEDDLLMVKSMLDLRMLESYCAEEDEQLEVPNLHLQFDVKGSLT